jgi:hypothetical protein
MLQQFSECPTIPLQSKRQWLPHQFDQTTEFRNEDRATAQWHFIDICLQDKESDLPARCPHGNCVTTKIDEYARRLRDGNYDKWGAAGGLAFLIHFVGDIHQPLHSTTNSDRGGTCQQVNVAPGEENLHHVWDDAVVLVLGEAAWN